ncbi:MAG: hypothetical protein KatS3mg097_117 [Candidatus Parcubacteria bacterium]|nr:MAG: hypothetical protein KatS3mg097_117 [Candidatus Parcubacteria bacterium]
MDIKSIEKLILNFWRNNSIFEKSLLLNKLNNKSKIFNWLEGPPYTNDKPHMGHFLTRVYKDSILRFFSMIGYYTPRRAGWDTHGLPIEVATEKRLGFQSKKDILNYGIDNFNQECKSLVTQFKNVWENMDEKMGFWIDHQKAYITFDPFYMQSCWWVIKNIYNQGLLSEEKKIYPYCFRCETILAQAELGMPDAYKNVQDISAYIKFELIDENKRTNNKEYLLVWTTTPWTLPGNLALAVNADFDYFLHKTDNGLIWSHKKFDYPIIRKKRGKDLIGRRYKPLFDLLNDKIDDTNNKFYKDIQKVSNLYKVYKGDFVVEGEGTGIVHIAPAYGEEDFKLGLENNLGMLDYLNDQGQFVIDIKINKNQNSNNEELVIKTKSLLFKDSDRLILDSLKKLNLLFKEETYEHNYPHCWRCKKPLIYKANRSWVIKVSKIKKDIVNNNKIVKWIPVSAYNRFYEWIKEGKDWNLSRTRFWGIPLPIWRCHQCQKIEVIGSLNDLAKFLPAANNNYYLMRHGGSLSLVKNMLSSYPELFFNPLTRKGVSDVKKQAKNLKNKIDIIYTSPVLRTKQTAMIIADEIKKPFFVDERLRELDLGFFQGKSSRDLEEYLLDRLEDKKDFFKKLPNGESFDDVRRRAINFLLELEAKHKNKNILIVSHGAVLMMLEAEMKGLNLKTIRRQDLKEYKTAEVRNVKFITYPRNKEGELDLHRPFVDNIKWQCQCGGVYERISEIADIWFDSGCVPFAANNYPFANKSEIDSNKIFPLDFIIEGIDQTRGWFYTLLVISSIIKKQAPYKNVIVSGLVLDEKGIKMSKSLGNVTDPMEIINQYGADPLRFYLLYLNEIYDNKSFDAKELLKIKNDFFGLLFNIFNFYKFYYSYQKFNFKGSPKKEVIDLWFEAKFKESYLRYYNYMTDFNVHKATRVIYELVGDFSRWWLRRSRDRFQNPKNKNEFFSAMVNFEIFFFQLLKMLAPLTPFVSEYFYQEIKNDLNKRYSLKESIHLERLSLPLKLTLKEKILLEEMEKIREIAAEVHRLRKEKGLKVRQPLKLVTLNTKFSEELLDILKEEINVVDIKIDVKQQEKIKIDFTITDDLKIIGIENDFVRFIQDLRQDAELTPKEVVFLNIEASGLLMNILQQRMKNILARTKTAISTKMKKIIAEKEFIYENFGKVKISIFL